MKDLVPILLSIVLFTITLILMYVLRRADQRNRKLDLMKRYVAQHEANMREIGDGFKETVANVEENIAQSQQEVFRLLQRLKTQQEDIQAHSEDLEELQKTLAYYHEVLGQLAAMTEKAEIRTSSVKAEVAKVEQVRMTINDFFIQIAAAEETIGRDKEQLLLLGDQQKEKLHLQIEDSIIVAKERIEALLQAAMSHTDKSFQTMISTVQAFLRELNNRTELLESVVKRLTDASAASLLALGTVIDDKREELNQRAGVLEDLSVKRLEMERQISEMTLLKDELAIEVQTAERDLEGLNQQAAAAQQLIQHQKALVDELDAALAAKQALIEEEERKELQRRAAQLSPEPELELEPEEEPELEPEEEPKKLRILHGHFEPEEDEEEIVLDEEE